MSEDFDVGPFGRLLPRPGTGLNQTVPSLNITPHGPTGISDNMTARGYFPKDVPTSNEVPGPGQQLPSVSHILSGRSYYDYPPPGKRPPSQEDNNVFHRSQYSREHLGGFTQGQGPPVSCGHYPHQSDRAHYRQGRDIPLHSPFTLSLPNPDHALQRPSIPLLLSRAGRPPGSEADTTHDQPRVPKLLGEENIPGKGWCYVYDDGTHCPKDIDGNSVNPQWGVTKAGKPRKRLAQACSTCREKKIRCDPGSSLSKCSQCLKFNRECRFEQQLRWVYSELHLYPC
jgi:hypothetical protein